MANYLTLDVVADGAGSRTSTPRAQATTFADGYEASTLQGLKGSTKSVEFAYTEDYSKTKPVEDFLTARLTENAPFYYSFYKNLEPARLYKIVGSDISFTHKGGNTFTVSATFKEYEGI